MTTLINSTESQIAEPQVSGIVRGARYLYTFVAILLMAGIALQVYFAGAALLVDSGYLETHRMFAHVLELFALVLPVVVIFSRLGWRIGLTSLLPFFLIAMQYVFLWALVGMGLPTWTRGLHAVNALVIFWVALYLTTSAWRRSRAS